MASITDHQTCILKHRVRWTEGRAGRWWMPRCRWAVWRGQGGTVRTCRRRQREQRGRKLRGSDTRETAGSGSARLHRNVDRHRVHSSTQSRKRADVPEELQTTAARLYVCPQKDQAVAVHSTAASNRRTNPRAASCKDGRAGTDQQPLSGGFSDNFWQPCEPASIGSEVGILV